MKKYRSLIVTGYIETLSYLILLGVAMPLKYVWEQPEMVKYTGWAHGFLFVAYGFMLLYHGMKNQWPFKNYIFGGLAALIPLGPLVFDKKVLKV